MSRVKMFGYSWGVRRALSLNTSPHLGVQLWLDSLTLPHVAWWHHTSVLILLRCGVTQVCGRQVGGRSKAAKSWGISRSGVKWLSLGTSQARGDWLSRDWDWKFAWGQRVGSVREGTGALGRKVADRWDTQSNSTYFGILEVKQAHVHTVHEGVWRTGGRPLGV